MKKARRKYDARFKAQVAIEAIKERETLSELAAKFELSPVMISRWKKEFIDNSASVFGNPVADDAALEKQKERYPMKKGFMYLTAIIDVYSRFIVGWSLHNTLDASNCIEVLKSAVARHGAPEIINSDQGCQFTSKEWADACAQYPEMKVSTDGRGRTKDNIWIERFWKTIKYEYIYIRPEETGTDLFFGIKAFIDDYNYHRRHQGINRTVPSKLYLRSAACA